MTNHRVLIANHDAVAANRDAATLRGVGYVVAVAFTSDEAVRISAETVPSLLVMNPQMPGLSGLEASRYIVQKVDCKVLFLTSLAGDPDFNEVLKGMVRDGIRCAALPANVAKADLIKFVGAELGPAVILTDTRTDEPRGESTPAARPAGPSQAAEPAASFNAIPNTEPYTPLFAIANSNLYQTNAFRLTGLQVTATAREINRAYQEFTLNKDLRRAWAPSLFIAYIVDPTNDEREAAFTQIRNPEQRLLQEFFWFWPEGNADEAFAALQKNQDGPITEWERRSRGNDPKGIATHNLAVVNHLMALQIEGAKMVGRPAIAPDYWKDAFRSWRAVLENSRFWDCLIQRIRDINDPRVTPDLAKRIWAFLPQTILSINAVNALRAAEAGDFAEAARQRQLIYGSGLGTQNAEKALGRALTPLLEHLTLLSSQATSQVASNPSLGLEIVRDLESTKSPLLRTLNCLVGADDVRRCAAHDEVATAIRDCLIAYVNETKAWAVALPLFENCLALAEGASLRSKLSEDISILQENVNNQQRAAQDAQPSSASGAKSASTAEPTSKPAAAPGRPSSGDAQKPTSSAHPRGFAIGRKWTLMSRRHRTTVVALALFVIIVTFVIARSNDSGTSVPPAPPPASGTSQPPPASPPVVETPQPRSFQAPTNDSELEALKAEITESKSQLQNLKDELRAAGSEIDECNSSAQSDKSALNQMESDSDAGVEVDQDQYVQIRRRYNQHIDRCNAKVDRYNGLLHDYRSLLAETNAKVDKYNSMVISK